MTEFISSFAPLVAATGLIALSACSQNPSTDSQMVDDCTLELHDFSYDGNGIDVRVYGSKNSTFKPAT